jgi:hypothetical protein
VFEIRAGEINRLDTSSVASTEGARQFFQYRSTTGDHYRRPARSIQLYTMVV